MVTEAPRRIALLSIHPRHAEAILDGRKLVELRRTRLSPYISHVLMYATAPVKAVVGCFEVGRIDEGTKNSIWKSHRQTCAVSRSEFRQYFDGASRAFAIEIARVYRFEDPVALVSLPGVSRPSQSFQCLEFETVRGFLEKQSIVAKRLTERGLHVFSQMSLIDVNG